MSPQRLVFIPGLLCDRVVWEFQAARLEQRALPWIVDHGRLDSLAAMAEAILAAAPERFSLAGHSMGARVALEIVRRAPARVERLALLDTGYTARPLGPRGELEAAGRTRLVALARTQGMRAMGRQWVERMVHPERLGSEALVGTILDMVERCPIEKYEGQIRALLERPDARDVLGQIRCPSLILCGRDDAWSPVEQHREMAELVAASRLVVIENCGHMATLERPEAVTEALGDWLSTQ